MPSVLQPSQMRFRLPTRALLLPLMVSTGLLGYVLPSVAAASVEDPALPVEELETVPFSPPDAFQVSPAPAEQGLLSQALPAPTLPPTGGASSPAQGYPVPWNAVPVGAPTAQGAMGTQPGMWMMIWVPYGMPGMPNAPTGVPQQQVLAYPVMIMPQGGYPVSQPPVATPTVPPQAYYTGQPWPYAAVPPVQPYGYAPMVPQPVPAPNSAIPYGASPYAYPIAPNGMAASAPVSPPANPYTSSSQGLTVPALPSAGPSQGQPTSSPLPPPPVSDSQPLTAFPASPQSVPAPSLNSFPQTPTVPTVSQVSPTGAAAASSQDLLIEPADSGPITEPSLNLQGLYVLQGDNSSARARLTGSTFLSPNLLVGGTLDVVTGPDLTNDDGIQLTELYLAASPPGVPELRFRLGQLDLTSYFDRNSFAKDIGRDFFNSIFHTNPALITGANVTASRPGGLVQWSITDDILLSAAAFSSAPNISDFALDGFAGEVGFRVGNLIVRGTYDSTRDTEFQGTGARLDAYGVNAEWFIPELNLGLFGRYGKVNNASLGFSSDTFSLGLNALDLFMENDRLGLAYGRNLSTASVNGLTPDALEVFYDFEVVPNIRVGFTFQQLNEFTESVIGFRIRGDLDLTPSIRGGETP